MILVSFHSMIIVHLQESNGDICKLDGTIMVTISCFFLKHNPDLQALNFS